MSVWVAEYHSFVDEESMKGQSPAEFYVKHFDDESYAEQYIVSCLYNQFLDCIKDLPPVDFNRIFINKDNKIYLKKDVSLAEFNALIEEQQWNFGLFVNEVCHWDIYEMEITTEKSCDRYFECQLN